MTFDHVFLASIARQLTRDAVVAVSERGDLFTAEVVAEVVEAAEEVVEQPHQLRRRLVRTHLGEAHDVREQDAHVLHRVHVERPEDVPDVTLQMHLEVLRVHNVIYNEGRPLSRDVLFFFLLEI